MTGIKMTHVPYKGTLPALNDVIAGHIPVMFSDIPPLLGNRRGGQGAADRRLDQGAGQGIPGRAAAQRGRRAGLRRRRLVHLVAPAKTPQPIIDKLHKELMAVMAMPDMKAQIDKLSLLPMDTPSVPEMQKFVKSEIERWGDIVKKAGIARFDAEQML